MTKKHRKKHVPTLKFVSENIDKNWKYDFEINKFSHPLYPNCKFDAICDNKRKEWLSQYKDKFGKKYYKKCSETISTLYPRIPVENDEKNIGYNFGSNIDIIPNKMQSFWNTRRGKRYDNYVSYRKMRDKNKKMWLKMNPSKINNKTTIF